MKRKHPGHRHFSNDDVFGKKKMKKLGKKKRMPANHVSLQFSAKGVYMPHQNLRAQTVNQQGEQNREEEEKVVVVTHNQIKDVSQMVTARNLSLTDVVRQFAHYSPTVVRNAVLSMRELCQKYAQRLLHTSLHIIVRESAPLIIYELDASVRREVIKLYEEEVFSVTEESHIRPFMGTFVIYVISGLTHMDSSLRLHALDILELLLNRYASSVVQFVSRLMPVLESCFDLSEHLFNTVNGSYQKAQWRTMMVTSLLIRSVLEHRNGMSFAALHSQVDMPSDSTDKAVRLESVHEDDHNVHIKLAAREKMMNNLMETALVRRMASKAVTETATMTNSPMQDQSAQEYRNENMHKYRMERVEHVAQIFVENVSKYWIKLWVEYSRISSDGEMTSSGVFKILREILDVMCKMLEWIEGEELRHTNSGHHLHSMTAELQRWHEHLLDGSHYPIVGSSLLRRPERAIVVGANVRFTSIISQVVRWGNDDIYDHSHLFQRMLQVILDLLKNDVEGCSLMSDAEWETFVRAIERIHDMVSQQARDLLWKLLIKQVALPDCNLHRKHSVLMMFCRVMVSSSSSTSRANRQQNQSSDGDGGDEDEVSQSNIPETVINWWVHQLASMLCAKDASNEDRDRIIGMMATLVQNGSPIELVSLFSSPGKKEAKQTKTQYAPLVTIMTPQQQSRLIHLLYSVDKPTLDESMIRALSELCCCEMLSGEHMMQLMQVLRFQFDERNNLDASLLTSLLMLVTIGGVCVREKLSWSMFEDLIREVIMTMQSIHYAGKLDGETMTRWLLSQMQKRSASKKSSSRSRKQASKRMIFGLLSLWSALSEWGLLCLSSSSDEQQQQQQQQQLQENESVTPNVVVEWLWQCQQVELIKQVVVSSEGFETMTAMLKWPIDKGEQNKIQVKRLVDLARITADNLHTVVLDEGQRTKVLQQWQTTIAWIRQHATHVLRRMDDMKKVGQCQSMIQQQEQSLHQVQEHK